MSIQLSALAQLKSEEKIQLPQLVLQIDGVETIYGVGEIKKYVRIGDDNLLIGDAWKIGGVVNQPNQEDAIDISGSSNTIGQQLLQDKGGATSVSSIQISLIDKDEAITRLITPGEVVDDILGRKAWVYLGYQDTAWPQDFVRIFAGLIDEIKAGPTIILNVAHPVQKERADIFQKITTELTQDFNYRSETIQGLRYNTRPGVVGTVTITYNSGGTAGSEIVNVAGNNITITLEVGVSTVNDIRNAIESTLGALLLVEVDVVEDMEGTLQTTQATTPLNSDTTAFVKSTVGMLLPVPSEGFRTYIRIDDEIIEYTGLTATTITGCTRAALADRDDRARGAQHETGDTVDTFYRLQGSAIDIALRVLLSGGPETFASDIPAKAFNFIEGEGPSPNTIWFDGINIQDAYGVVVGDKATVTGATLPANNVVDAEVSFINSTPFGSYIVFEDAGLEFELNTAAVIAFKSKWNVLPKGAGLEMGGDEVDVPEFEKIKEVFSSSLFEYDFYMKDTVEGKAFIESDVLFPTGCYSLPRKGKISAGFTTPPIGGEDLKFLNSSNTTKPQNTRITRSINKYFYNNVLFKFNEAVTDDLFLSGDLAVSEDSKNRIKIGSKSLVIEARGLRPSSDQETITEILKRRFQERYKFGAEKIETTAFYGTSFNIDVGDVVVFGDSVLQLPDTKRGSRTFNPRLFEVSNKSLSIKTGEVKLELVDTGYALAEGRYGGISPSSQLLALGSTGNIIKIKNSYETTFPQIEKTKWQGFIGEGIVVHDVDWDNVFLSTLIGFSSGDNYSMIIDGTPPFPILDDYVVEIAPYAEPDPEENILSKRVFVYTNPTVEVVSGTTQSEFEVDIADADKFLEGAVLIVRDIDWDIVSPEVRVELVAGTTITVNSALGFIPSAGMEVDLIGFKDSGPPYRYL